MNLMQAPVCEDCYCLFLIQAKELCRLAGSLWEGVEARCLWMKHPRPHPGACVSVFHLLEILKQLWIGDVVIPKLHKRKLRLREHLQPGPGCTPSK